MSKSLFKKAMSMQVLKVDNHNWKVCSIKTRKDNKEKPVKNIYDVTYNSANGYFVCTCPQVNKEMYCSHCLAVIYRTQPMKFRRYMEGLPFKPIKYTKMLDMSRKYEINKIKFGANEGAKHITLKRKVCENLLEEGKNFICEAKFSEYYGNGEADVFNVTDNEIIEILSSESEKEFYEIKIPKYPWNCKLRFVKAK